MAYDSFEIALRSIALIGANAEKNVAPQRILEVIESACGSFSMTAESWGRLAHEVGELLDLLEESLDVDAGRLGRLELIFSRLLFHTRKPKRLNRLIASDPSVYVELLKAVYRTRDKSIVEDEPASASLPAMAAHSVLEGLTTLPGQAPDGSIDSAAMLNWVTEGRRLADESHRLESFENTLGGWFAKCPPGSDGVFPHEAVREVFQYLESIEFERGFAIGVHNGRGVVTKDPEDGGEQERVLADKYEGYAAHVNDKWHRAALALRMISKSYVHEAKREDRQRGLE